MSFDKTMREEVGQLAGDLGVDEDRAFAVWYAMHAFRLDEDEALEATSYDGGNDRPGQRLLRAAAVRISRL
jgi:hypothetical protein